MSKFKSQFKKDTDNIAKLASVKIHNVGHEACDPLHNWSGVREYYSLHAVVAGCGTFSTEQGEFSLKAGDAFLIYPNQVVSYTADENQPWEYLWLGISGAFVQNLMDLTDFTAETPCIYGKDGIAIKEYLLNIYHAQGSGFAQELEMIGLTYVFLSKLMSQGKNPLSLRFAHYGQKAKELIDLNYGGSMSSQEVADRLNISRSHLHRVFSQEYGMSIGKYIQQVRMNRACFLLDNSPLRIYEISNSVGYENQLYFSSAFKKHTGISPTEYRKKTALEQ